MEPPIDRLGAQMIPGAERKGGLDTTKEVR